MFWIWRHRGRPDTWVRLTREGRSVQEGVGLDVWRTSGSTLIVVPVGLRETAFRCRARTRSGNLAWLEGQVEWRFTDPETAAARFDFAVAGPGASGGDGLGRFESCLRRDILSVLREATSRRDGAELDSQLEDMARESCDSLRRRPLVASMFVEIASLWLEDPAVSGKDSIPAPVSAPTLGYSTGVLSSHPLAESWRKEVSLLARVAPRFVGPMD